MDGLKRMGWSNNPSNTRCILRKYNNEGANSSKISGSKGLGRLP
jgi:hypothetical protein